MTPRAALAFVRKHGVVLQAGRGPVPSLAEAVAGCAIQGSWWGHPAGKAIFRALGLVRDSPDVLACRAAGGKVTLVHRRLWPALWRLRGRWAAADLSVIREEHTASGAHRVVTESLGKFLGAEVKREGEGMEEREAETQLGEWAARSASTRTRTRTGTRTGRA